jgi:RHS repeat-associated protein
MTLGPTTGAANVIVDTTFNTRLQPTNIQANSGALLSLAYDYCLMDCTKNNGNVLKQTISFTGFSEAQTYSYDALNRLQQAQTPVWTQKNGYDAWGNRWVSQQTNLWPLSSLTPQGTDTSSSWFDTNKNQISSWSYDHGNLLTAGVNGLTYDGENRITARTNAPNSTQYGYDAQGQRITKTELLSGQVQSTTVFVYDGQGQLTAEYGSSTDTGRSYLIGDALGSTRLIVGATGAVKARYDYLPFGEEIWATYGGRTTAQKYRDAATFDQPDGTTAMKFTGKERDSETGLDYFGARYFSGAQGRFTSADKPFADQNVFDPQSWNLYTYVRNNPVRFVDRTGSQAQGELAVWMARHEPELAAAARAIMIAKDVHSFGAAIKEVVWGSANPSEKIQRAIENDNVGIATEGIIAELIAQQGFRSDIVDVDVKIKDPTNPSQLLTQLDVLMKYAIIEIKSGKDVVSPRQIKRQLSFGRPVLVFAPEATAYDLSEIQRLGAHGYTSLDLLVKSLENIKRESVKSELKPFDPKKWKMPE